MTNKEYLGDGVYATLDRDRVVLTAENGSGVTQAVVLEAEVYAALIDFVERALAD